MLTLPPIVDEVLQKMETGEPIDWENVAARQGFHVAKIGENFAREMIDLGEESTDANRYSNVKSIVFNADGSIQVEFK